MEIILTLLYASIFSLIIYKSKFFKIENLTRRHLTAFFLLKIIAGVGMYFIYTHYYNDRYNSDIFKYFDDSKIMYDALWNKPLDYLKMLFGFQNDSAYFDKNYYYIMNNWYRVYESNLYNDSHTVIRFNAFIRIFSFGYYNVHTVFICFFSFVGLTGIYKSFVNYVRGKEKLWASAVFLIPSVVFWGSGVLKEGILFFGMGVLIYCIYSVLNGKYNILIFIGIIFSFILLFYTKFYIISILAPLLVVYAWNIKYKKFPAIKYLVVMGIAAIAVLNLHLIFPEFNILEILTRKQHDFFGLANEFNSGSLIYIPKLEANLFSFLKSLPLALFNTLLRPHFFDITSPLILMPFLENLIMFTFTIISLIYSNFKNKDINLLAFTLLFVFLTYSLVGLTTPVLGAIVRYKVPALPFYFLIFILILDKEKLIRRFPKLQKFI